MSHPIYIVDVFTERRFGGNQLAVVLDADDLSTEAMQQIALETNFSETTFVTSRELGPSGYPVRIFTPGQELPFAGHPTLGTAWVIRRHVAESEPASVALSLGVGRVPVTFERASDGAEAVWFTAPPIEFGPSCAPDRMASALGLTADDIDRRAPVQQLSAGIVVVIVPVRSKAALDRCRLDVDRFASLAAEGFRPFVYVFCAEPEMPGNDMAARFFFEANGIREDPATGSATACLGRYLLVHGFLGAGDVNVRIEQGAAVGRPSLLMLQASEQDGLPVIRVGGGVVPVMDGRLL